MHKKDLALALSSFSSLATPSASLEQYATPSELAADVLWTAFLQGDIQDKVIADLGCGNGILGLGALLLGAKKVYFVDIDKKAIALAKQHFLLLQKDTGKKFSAQFLLQPVEQFRKKVAVVLQNPPFGVQREHADKVFLETAMNHADVIYTLHKVESKAFITALIRDYGFRVTSFVKMFFPLPKTQRFHTKNIYRVPIGFWRLARC